MAEQVDNKWYEYIVVGCGGIGSGAVYWLSKQAGASKYHIAALHTHILLVIILSKTNCGDTTWNLNWVVINSKKN